MSLVHSGQEAVIPGEIDPRTGRPVGDHGTALDAINFLLDAGTDYGPGEETLFLESWRTGDLGEWPEFYEWLGSKTPPPAASVSPGMSEANAPSIPPVKTGEG